MLYQFLSNNRDELAFRCRVKVGERVGRSATEKQLNEGIPLFLDQLIRTLKVEQTAAPLESRLISGPSGGAAQSEVSISAAQHGKNLLNLGLSVDQVVHDYGDLCQAITDLAVERDVPFMVDEFRTLNRCLDNAISEAVTEFSFQKEALASQESSARVRLKMGHFAHELRNLLNTASLAYSAAKAGNLGLSGATGTILGRSLAGLEKLIAGSLEEIREIGSTAGKIDPFSLAEFIAEVSEAAQLSAGKHGCRLRVAEVDPRLAMTGARDQLVGAVANLLQNAFKFTRPATEVSITAHAVGDRVHIDVSDHCGGLGIGVAESMFLPFSQAGNDRTGLGLGLAIARQGIAENGGYLTVKDVPTVGCVFTVDMLRHTIATTQTST